MSLVSFVKVEKETEIKKGILYALDLIQYKLPTIDLLREKISPDTDISIVESDASAMKCKYAFKMLNYEKLSDEYDVRLVNLSKEETVYAK